MSLTGNLADVAIADLMQFVHMSGRSGTLVVERDGTQGYISFHRGRIVSAWSPNVSTVADLLLQSGELGADALAHARTLQAAELPPPPLGQVLVASGAISRDALRAAITRKVEHTVYELVAWTRGAFRFEVDEVRGDHEIALAPGDVMPELDLNTQMVLLEALRLFDERNQRGAALPAPAPAARAPICIHIVSRDARLMEALAIALGERAALRRVRLRDAGMPAPGQEPPLVILDARAGGVTVEQLRRLRQQHPRALCVAVSEPGADAGFYEAGAAAAVPPSAPVLAACCATLLSTRQVAGLAPEVELRSGLARLRRVLGDLRSGLLSATMSLNLMAIVADSLERAVLFVVQRSSFVAVGAFGTREDGTPLAHSTRGLALTTREAQLFARCIADGRARVVDHGAGELPATLLHAVDRPRAGQAVLFPVLGTRRIIALIYADNGRRLRAIDDVELVEIATAQVGLAFENELLRRQLSRTAAATR
jgi:Domain of unknown function (DUF4388)